MNARTAKLLRKYAFRHRHSLRDLKRTWRRIPRNERRDYRKQLQESLA